MKSWPLRVKLVALMMVLLALALIITGAANVYSTRDYLNKRLDQQLHDTVRTAMGQCGGPGGYDGHGPPTAPAQRNGFYIACVNDDGTLSKKVSSGQGLPTLPDTVVGMQGTYVEGDPTLIGAYDTVKPTGGTGHDWRVLYARPYFPNDPDRGQIVVVAISYNEVDETVNQMIVRSAAIGAGVLLVLAVVAYVLVRSSLQPLVEVEETAEAIAAGDLSRRVPDADPRTEVGGLSVALNTMLGQIETAFDERRASEEAALASEEAARASEERMRRFVADASHELRTPLTSIRGFAELHRQAGHHDETIGRIEHHATRMGLLVDDLLLLARMDQQRPLEKSPVDLLSLATDALIDAKVTATEHRLRLRLRTTGSDDDEADVEPPIVLGDEARLRQVVQNLVANALTHTPPGTEVTVFVGTEGHNAVLEVADNGPGMTPEDAARVFERFYRTDPSRTRALGGSGLGLSIVAALVHAHGGQVTLKTAPGQGAAFRVTIPLLRPGAA